MTQIRERRVVEVACPHCAEGWSRVDHLFDGREHSTTWTCHECGFPFDVKITVPERVEVSPSKSERCSLPCWDVLVLPPQQEPVFFILKANDYREHIGDEPYEGKEYFYNEHTCPTNWTSSIVKIISEGDLDPHGLFEYMTSYARRPDEEEPDLKSFIPKLVNSASQEP